MIRITYDARNGTVIPDGRVFSIAKQIMNDHIRNGNVNMVVSNALLISEIRVFIHYGLLKNQDVMFIFENEHIPFDGDSHCLQYWPKGFCDIWDRQLDILVDWGKGRDVDIPDRYVKIA